MLPGGSIERVRIILVTETVILELAVKLLPTVMYSNLELLESLEHATLMLFTLQVGLLL
jgi:hypothetical protein